MFAYFPNACGVANLRDFAGRMEAEPAWIADARGGGGFVEIAEIILAVRAYSGVRLSGQEPEQLEIS